MSQLFCDLEFSTCSEARYRILIGAMIVQFNLEHNGLLRLGRNDSTTYRPATCMSRASDENVPSKQAVKAWFAAQALVAKLAM